VHGIEAELSIFSNLTSRTYARQTMRIVYQHLPLVYEKTDNKFAREKMAYAEFLGGLAFNSASLGFIHSMSHAMSGVFNTPHGLANAVLLPYVLDYELKSKKIVPKIANLSRFMQMNNASEDVFGKAQETIRNLIAFTKALGVPSNLSEVQPKISKKDIRQMAKKAMKDFCGISNPIQFSRREVIRIYHNAISGKFDNI
jgi:alcohol dehydrogenase